MDMPELKFVELKDKTEEEFDQFIMDRIYDGSSSGGFLVYIRQRYDWDGEDWEYLIEYGNHDWEHYDKIPTFVWEHDWNEGQQIVEYLGVCAIP